MALERGHEIPTIDVERVVIRTRGTNAKTLVLNTASQIGVEPQIETQDAIKLIIKSVLKSQKGQVNTLTGNKITLTDNVFNPELVLILQGGEIEYDQTSNKIKSYKPPLAGADQSERGEVFDLDTYSAIYSAAGIIDGYEKTTYPNCQGVPVSLSAQDNTFRVPEYTINSAPDVSQSPYEMSWVAPSELPALPAAKNVSFVTP